MNTRHGVRNNDHFFTEVYSGSNSQDAQNLRVIWISRDPITKEISFYPPPFNSIIEKAFREHKYNAEIDYFACTIHFNSDGNHTQSTEGCMIGSKWKEPGSRSVRRILVSTDLSNIDLPVSYNGRYILTTSDQSQDIVRFAITPQMFVSDVEVELVPVWKCSKKIGSSSYVSDEWDIYTSEVNALIEAGMTTGSDIEIDIGAKKYKISYQGGIYALQTNEQFGKQRILRRELISKEEYEETIAKLKMENNSEEQCPICLEIFKDSYTFESFETECFHRIHTICAQTIADNSDPDQRRCPMCRGDVNWAVCCPHITINTGLFGGNISRY